MRYEVYAHTSPSGKIYVGWTSLGSDARWRMHLKLARGGSPTAFHAAIRKYGPANFTHSVLEVMRTPEGARHAEQLWIARLSTRAPRGYNLTDGGDGVSGLTPSDETRAKLSRALKGRPSPMRGRPGPMKGRTHTSEARAKMSAAHKEGRNRPPPPGRRGVPLTSETRAKISAALRGRIMSRDAVERTRLANIGARRNDEARAKMRAAWVIRKARAS